MKPSSAILALILLSLVATPAFGQTSLLFIGNGFTYGHGSAVRFYRADSVTDLNGSGSIEARGPLTFRASVDSNEVKRITPC